jgi:hypothetical protein
MKANKAPLYRLRNEEYFEFFTQFKMLAEAEGIQNLISDEYQKFITLYKNADTVLELLRKSPLTKEIAETDNNRDMLFNGLRASVKALQSHFDPDKQRAAEKVMLLFNQYGYLGKKGYAEETAAIYNIVQDMQEKFTAEVATLGLQEWVTKLSDCNVNFRELILERNEEQSLKPKFRMVDVRKDMEACYENIIKCLEAATIVNSSHNLTGFFDKLNSNVDRFRNVLSLREGRAAARKGRNPQKPGEIINIPASANAATAFDATANEVSKKPDQIIDIPAKKVN